MFISLFNSEHGFVSTDQRVFAPDELQPLLSALDQAQQLSMRLSQQQITETQAMSEARDEGYAAGLASGKQQAALDAAATIKSLHDKHKQAIEELQASAAELAVEIVRKIAGQVSTTEWLAAQAQLAAEDLTDQPGLKLRVHTLQVDGVRARLAEYPDTLIQQVTGDDFLPSNGCVLESKTGQIDVDLDTQLDNVLALLNETADTAFTVEDSSSSVDPLRRVSNV